MTWPPGGYCDSPGAPQDTVDQYRKIASDGDLDDRCRQILAHAWWLWGLPRPAEEPPTVDDICAVCRTVTAGPLCGPECAAEAAARVRVNVATLRALKRRGVAPGRRYELTEEIGYLTSALLRYRRP